MNKRHWRQSMVIRQHIARSRDSDHRPRHYACASRRSRRAGRSRSQTATATFSPFGHSSRDGSAVVGHRRRHAAEQPERVARREAPWGCLLRPFGRGRSFRPKTLGRHLEEARQDAESLTPRCSQYCAAYFGDTTQGDTGRGTRQPQRSRYHRRTLRGALASINQRAESDEQPRLRPRRRNIRRRS